MIDWTHIEMIAANTEDGWPVGIWRNHYPGSGIEWSRNLIDDCIDVVEDAYFEDGER